MTGWRAVCLPPPLLTTPARRNGRVELTVASRIGAADRGRFAFLPSTGTPTARDNAPDNIQRVYCVQSVQRPSQFGEFGRAWNHLHGHSRLRALWTTLPRHSLLRAPVREPHATVVPASRPLLRARTRTRAPRGAECGSLARGTLFLSEYPRQPEVREGAVAAKPGDRGDLLALEGQDEHSVQSGDLGLGGWEVDAECWLGVGAGRYQ
jgi:hypothetical protein